ncbi:hypothetical protein N7530_005982 [Penicillium desertorum]|uniref:Oleate hydratase n=1 Tax=Penicillium desertorum TaxID=1303715 RepID=A0A9X0BS11_9EURO|nr:hypothetical protein N7530_005982 [Penicillium desertorum]
MAHNRDPKDVQAWLIGSGIASLAAAVHLVKQANIPARQVHILDVHKGSGGAMEEVSGDPNDGYVLHTGAQPYFHEDCVEELLKLVPSPDNPENTIWDTIEDYELHGGPGHKTKTRLLRHRGEETKVDTHGMQIGAKLRMDLVVFLLDREKASDSRRISDVFDGSFFQTEFWTLWSTTFLLQPWHSAAEFRRLLAKYLPKLQTHGEVPELERTRFSLYETLIIPITKYLKDLGAGDPTTISEIIMLEDGKERLITVDPSDIVIVTLGSISTGMQTGSNQKRPEAVSAEALTSGEWSLWKQLADKSLKFGNPSNFSTRVDETKIETFTVTLRESDFMKYYSQLTKDKPGTGSLITIKESPWGLNVSVPHQPVFKTQPEIVDLIWGYGLHPEKTGTYVKKPMEECSGEEIFLELLSHMKFPTDSLLPLSTTIPCLFPLGTSTLLTRKLNDRPSVIPHDTTNVAFIGQYVDIPNDTTFSVEYSVRGAQMAVSRLMGLPKEPPKINKNVLLEVLQCFS